jgi:hypothetical protein
MGWIGVTEGQVTSGFIQALGSETACLDWPPLAKIAVESQLCCTYTVVDRPSGARGSTFLALPMDQNQRTATLNEWRSPLDFSASAQENFYSAHNYRESV